MELSILLAEQIFSLLLMVLTGYVVRKLNVVPKSGRKVLASIVLYVSAPCIVFDSFQIEYSSEKLFGLVVGLHWRFLYGQLLCARRFFICQLQNRHRLLMRIQAI